MHHGIIRLMVWGATRKNTHTRFTVVTFVLTTSYLPPSKDIACASLPVLISARVSTVASSKGLVMTQTPWLAKIQPTEMTTACSPPLNHLITIL